MTAALLAAVAPWECSALDAWALFVGSLFDGVQS